MTVLTQKRGKIREPDCFIIGRSDETPVTVLDPLREKHPGEGPLHTSTFDVANCTALEKVFW